MRDGGRGAARGVEQQRDESVAEPPADDTGGIRQTIRRPVEQHLLALPDGEHAGPDVEAPFAIGAFGDEECETREAGGRGHVACDGHDAFPGRIAPSHLWQAVAAAVADEANDDPSLVPAAIAGRGLDATVLTDGIHRIGVDVREAGWRPYRYPGMRDRVDDRHPLLDRLKRTIRRAEPGTPSGRIAALLHPTSLDLVLRASVYRFAPLIGPSGALDRIYCDAQGRLAFDPHYQGAAYDADHCPGELMRQVIDVTLLDWVLVLDWLREHRNDLFEAVWVRDAVTVERLLRDPAPLPPMPFLRMVKCRHARFKALVGIFWELERLYELLHAFGGPDRVTLTRLRATLASTSTLGSAIGADTRTARYAASAWCHRYTLIQLFSRGADAAHDDAHPHVALGQGQRTAMDELGGSLS